MRFFGHTVSSAKGFSVTSALGAGFLALLAAATFAAAPAASAQTTAASPFVLPYTMSTYAGPHAAYTVGAACGTNIALDTTGDGCIAPLLSIGIDPHDIRVDQQGNVFWIDDNGGSAIIHRINGQTLRQSVYVGSLVNTSGGCSTETDTQGDGCLANDGGANVTKSMFSAKTPKSRGLGVGNNGDLFYADYNGYYDHKVNAATGILSVVAGTGVSGYVEGVPGKSQVASTRGIGVDAAGNVYIADTGNNVIRFIPVGGGTSSSLTAANAAGTKTVTSSTPAIGAIVDAPEDVQIDPNGNIFIADAGNNCVRAIYKAGNMMGIVSPQVNYIYTVAGSCATPVTGYANATATPPVAATAPTYTYPADGTTPTVLATSVALGVRKISLDAFGNLYVADSTWNVIWFVDHATGYMRLLAGRYYSTATAAGGGAAPAPGQPAIGCVNGNTLGDGCTGAQSQLYFSADGANAADNQGNLYITDAEGGVAANSRLRKLTSGLNFPAVTTGATLTQNIYIHFTAGDTPATAGAYTIAGSTAATEDYTTGAQACTLEADTTTDCILPIIFKPVRPGYDTATITITSAKGNVSSYLVTGTGTGNAIAIDPGSVTVQNAAVNNAQGVAVDGNGNIYTADTGNNRVLLTSATTGVTSPFAGTGAAGRTGDGGPATAALLSGPKAVAVDTDGNVYIADTGNNVVRRVAAGLGTISTYAGGATAGCTTNSDALGDGCLATQATLVTPSGIVADNLGNLYVSDTGDNLIRVIGTDGYITLFAGGGTAACAITGYPGSYFDTNNDGCGAKQAILKAPAGLAFDATNMNILVADAGNSLVRKIYLGTTYDGASPTTAPTATVYTSVINPITAVAGNGSAGASIDPNNLATGSQLSNPTGVAVGPNGLVYIADTGNAAIRLVTPSTGTISTIAGILSSPGTGTVPGAASNVQLTTPGAVAVTPLGTLQIADSGNNRVLTDTRSQVTFQFGRVNLTFASPLQNFIETNIGNTAVTLPTPLLTPSAAQTQFTLTPPSGSTGCGSGVLAAGASCLLQGQFTPAAAGTFSTTFTEVGAMTTTGDPSITLTGTGAVLTRTTSVVAQTSPATGNAQFGAALTVTATVTPAACNTAAPACYPTGTVRFIIDGGNPGSPIATAPNTAANAAFASQSISGLSVGTHTISCNYSGDNFYAASTCGTTTITVATASTTALLSATNSGQVQYLSNNCTVPSNGTTYAGDTYCTVTTLTATVVSNTVGIPNGTITFYANGMPLGSSSLNTSTGVASLPLVYVLQGSTASGNLSYTLLLDTTLAPGTYNLTCTYSGGTNYSVSSCPAIQYTVLPQVASFSLVTRGCSLTTLIPDGLLTPSVGNSCPSNTTVPTTVSTAQGSTTDASIFIVGSNTLSGTLTFSCSGLPHASTCNFSPSSVVLAPGTTYAAPASTDMTLFTDVQPGPGVALNRSLSGSTTFAGLLGWPLALVGLFGALRFRRSTGAKKALSLLALLLTIAGSSLAVTGCAGPGAYKADLTPAGTYPITVNVTNGTLTQSTVIYFKVYAPGLPGQE